MKKITTSLVLALTLTLSLWMTTLVTTQAAIGIPDYLQPQNTALKGLNATINDTVKKAETSGNGQQGAVDAVNIALQYIANILLFFAAPLAVLFIARAGADYAFAMGEDTGLENAKRELLWSLLGLALVMFSYILVRAFIQPLPILQDATNSNAAVQQAVINSNVIEGQKNTANDPGAEAEAANEEAAAKADAEKQAAKKAADAAAANQAKQDATNAILNRGTLETIHTDANTTP